MPVTSQPALVRFPLPAPLVPYDTGPELRAIIGRQPVTQVELPDGSSAWLVTGHSEVREVLIDQRYSRALAVSPDRPQRGVNVIISRTLLGMDPPEHSRLRKLAAGAFTERRMQSLRSKVTRLVDELLDQMVAGPRPADLVHAFSLPLPAGVICELLGVPVDDFEKFHGWSDTLFSLFSGWNRAGEEMSAAYFAITGYMADLIAAKRVQPADDLIGELIAARDESDRLSEDELVSFCLALLIAGLDTTATRINMCLVALFHHPDEMARLCASPGLIPGAVEELLRYVQVFGASSVPILGRITKEEVRLGGVTIPAGEVVLPLKGAANRDPSAFADPDRLDLTRVPKTHLTFGAGAHHCLGAQLARMMLQETFRGLLGRLPGLRLAVRLEDIRSKENNSMHELPVTWDDP